MKIAVISKKPPGGRCTLYLRYAEALAASSGGAVEIIHCGKEGAIAPPPCY